MKKETLYIVAICLLIVLNLLQVGARFMAKNPPADPMKMAIKQIGLDDVQEKQFRQLAEAHRKQMVDFRNKQALLTETYINQPSDSLMNEVVIIERKKIEVTSQHFIDVKNILNDNQKEVFEVFKRRTIKRILGFPPPNKPH